MSSIEKQYQDAIKNMTGLQKVHRTASLYEEMKKILFLQIQTKFPNLTEREVLKRVSKRMYLSDESTQKLIDRIESH